MFPYMFMYNGYGIGFLMNANCPSCGLVGTYTGYCGYCGSRCDD